MIFDFSDNVSLLIQVTFLRHIYYVSFANMKETCPQIWEGRHLFTHVYLPNRENAITDRINKNYLEYRKKKEMGSARGRPRVQQTTVIVALQEEKEQYNIICFRV